MKSWLIGKDSDAGRDWGAGGEGDDRGWDGWMASLTRWTWVSVNSWIWWWTGRPGVLQFMESQRVGHDWATELNWTELLVYVICLIHKQMYMKVQGFPGGSVVKNMPVMQETWVWSLVRRIPWRREWLPTIVFFPGESPWIVEPGYSPWGGKEVDTTELLTTGKTLYKISDLNYDLSETHCTWGNHRLSTRCFFHLAQSPPKHMLASTRKKYITSQKRLQQNRVK